MRRLMIFLLFFSCSGSNSEIGCWRITAIIYMGETMPADNSADQFCFYEDGRMELIVRGKVERYGTYTRSDDGRMIIITYSTGTEEVLNNVTIDGSAMTFDGRDFSVVMEKD